MKQNIKASKVFSQNRVLLLFVEQNIPVFTVLCQDSVQKAISVGLQGSVPGQSSTAISGGLQGSVQDRVQQLVVELWVQQLVVELVKALSQDRVQQLLVELTFIINCSSFRSSSVNARRLTTSRRTGCRWWSMRSLWTASSSPAGGPCAVHGLPWWWVCQGRRECTFAGDPTGLMVAFGVYPRTFSRAPSWLLVFDVCVA